MNITAQLTQNQDGALDIVEIFVDALWSPDPKTKDASRSSSSIRYGLPVFGDSRTEACWYILTSAISGRTGCACPRGRRTVRRNSTGQCTCRL
jgi:hypothetical protein